MTDGRLSRRRVLGAMAATGALGLAGCSSGGGNDTDTSNGGDGGGNGGGNGGSTTGDGNVQGNANASGTVKIGVLQPLSGNLQYYGKQSVWGFLSGLAYKTDTDPVSKVQTGSTTVEAGDVTYELLIRDTKFSADTAQTLATNLVQNEDVDMLFGCSSSASAGRVIDTVINTSAVDIPFMAGPAASADITASDKSCSKQVFRANENTAMDARSGGTYVARETDVERVFLMGADYSFGKAVVNNYKTVLKNEGVEIVGQKFVPQGYSEFDGLFQQAVDANADAVIGGFTVATLPNFMTTAANYDVRVFGGFATEITNGVVGDVLKNILGTPLSAKKIEDAEVGPFTTRYHWNQYDNPINDAFVEMYSKAYGKVPDLFTSGTFTAASATVQAVEETGSTEGVDIQGGLRGMTVADTPKGEDAYVFQKYNNQARSEMTVAWPVPTSKEYADRWGASIMPGKPVARVPGKDATIPQDSDQMNCSL